MPSNRLLKCLKGVHIVLNTMQKPYLILAKLDCGLEILHLGVVTSRLCLLCYPPQAPTYQTQLVLLFASFERCFRRGASWSHLSVILRLAAESSQTQPYRQIPSLETHGKRQALAWILSWTFMKPVFQVGSQLGSQRTAFQAVTFTFTLPLSGFQGTDTCG